MPPSDRNTVPVLQEWGLSPISSEDTGRDLSHWKGT